MKRMCLALIIPAAVVMAVRAMAADFSLNSPQITEGGNLAETQVLNGFGCAGGNISPALSWTGAPEETKSFAVTVYDPDAPTGSGWWHWLVFNIPAQVHSLPEGAGTSQGVGLPEGAVQGRTDFGVSGYGGACPPPGHGDHHYIFTVWALDTPRLDLGQDASGAMLGFFLHQHSLGMAKITTLYGR